MTKLGYPRTTFSTSVELKIHARRLGKDRISKEQYLTNIRDDDSKSYNVEQKDTKDQLFPGRPILRVVLTTPLSVSHAQARQGTSSTAQSSFVAIRSTIHV